MKMAFILARLGLSRVLYIGIPIMLCLLIADSAAGAECNADPNIRWRLQTDSVARNFEAAPGSWFSGRADSPLSEAQRPAARMRLGPWEFDNDFLSFIKLFIPPVACRPNSEERLHPTSELIRDMNAIPNDVLELGLFDFNDGEACFWFTNSEDRESPVKLSLPTCIGMGIRWQF